MDMQTDHRSNPSPSPAKKARKKQVCKFYMVHTYILFICYSRQQLAIHDNTLAMRHMILDNAHKTDDHTIYSELRGGLQHMKQNISVESISKIISNQIPNIDSIYKPHWINASTDLQRDFGMSWLEITDLLLEIEGETGVEIVALPIQYAPSFKIGYFVNLFTYAKTFNLERHNAELLKYSCDNVPIYKAILPEDNKKSSCHLNIFGEHHFHDIGTEFDSITSCYYSRYQYGNILYNKVVELSGYFSFSMCTEVEKLLSNLPLWRKRKEWYGIAPKDKSVQLVTENVIGNRLAPPKTNPFRKEKGLCLAIPEHVITHSKDNNWFTELTMFGPKWLKGTSCSLYTLSIIMRRLGESLHNVIYIEIEAENTVSVDIVKYINDTFKNATIAVVISNNHTGPIFYTCPNGHNHCVSSKISTHQADDEKQNDFPYSELFLTSHFRVAAPVINIDSFLCGNIINEADCDYQNNEDIVNILSACGFDGFFGGNNILVSVATIRMCIGLVNSEYNNPIAAIQLVQVKSGTVRLYLLLKTEFIRWEKRLAESITSTLHKWGTSEMEWELVFLDELFPCEYTGAKIYYQNRCE